MTKKKYYIRTRFSAETIKEAVAIFRDKIEASGEDKRLMTVTLDAIQWRHDSEDEFFSDYRRSTGFGHYHLSLGTGALELFFYDSGRTDVSVQAKDRATIESIFHVFERNAANAKLPEAPLPKPTIFIGHGHGTAWRDLKDHLHDKHGYDIEAYEIGARAGHAIRDILTDMLKKSSMAFLVMTGDDETKDGKNLARQNVVHEAGLFQGYLAWSKAIILLEDGTEEFSNISGIQQIRFSKGNIKETFGEVLATIARETKKQAAAEDEDEEDSTG